MSGKHSTKKQKLKRNEFSLNYNTDACPYCEEEWPMDLLMEHMNSCVTSYLSIGRKKTMRENVQSLLFERPASNETFLEIDRSTRDSSARRIRRYMPPSSNSIAEGNESESPKARTSSLKENNVSEPKGAYRLIQNLENLLNSEWCSDVVLKNADHEFRAHRVILGARSPVFASMFQHDMVEKATGEVDISDCSTAGFKSFLQFLYSGKADISSANVLDLYYAADKYQVDDLKADCVEHMKNSMSVDTFCDVISLSIRHCESDLQGIATQFFCRHIKSIVKTTQWEKYLTENPIHANKLIIAAIKA